MTNKKVNLENEVLLTPSRLEVTQAKPVSKDIDNARLMTNGALGATMIVDSYFKSTKVNLGTIFSTLQEQARALHNGDMSQVESMLIGQAVALQSMFVDFAVRAKNATTLGAVQGLAQLALRSQAGSRSTLQTLADVKNPRQVAFVKQTNVAQTQQVNNGCPLPSREKKIKDQPIELLVKDSHGSTKMDSGAKAEAGRVDKELVSLDASHGAHKRGRKAKSLS